MNHLHEKHTANKEKIFNLKGEVEIVRQTYAAETAYKYEMNIQQLLAKEDLTTKNVQVTDISITKKMLYESIVPL